MGRRGSGTGSPNWFRCYRARRGEHRDQDYEITLTGRTKPYYPPRALGSRSVFTSYEYTCGCGYTGWSNHMTLAYKAGDKEALRRTGRSA